MDNVALLRRVLLLVVLFAPLGFALLTVGSRGLARRLAAGLAAVHVCLTGGLVAVCAGDFHQRGERLAAGLSRPTDGFRPIAVPGDTSTQPDLDDGETAWTLFELAPTGPGVPPAAIQFYVGLDGLNLWLVALASVMTLVGVLASANVAADKPGRFFAWLFALQCFVTGAFVSYDLVLFYVFFELTLVPAFFLIGKYGVGGGRREAARTFVLYTLFGSLLTLAGAVGLVLTNPTPINPVGAEPRAAYVITLRPDGALQLPAAGPVTFSIPRLMQNVGTWALTADYTVRWAEARAAGPDVSLAEAGRLRAEVTAAEVARDRRQRTQLWLFVLLVAGFAVKTPIVPFHSWLPAAYAEAPLGATLLFSAVLAKLGTFGLLRIVLPLCPDAAVAYGLPVFGTLGAVGVVYAALCAYAQRDLKLLAAYSSVSHLGFLVLGLFTLTPEGITGAALHMVNHGLTAGGLFAVLAVLYDRYRTLDVNAYGGLAAHLPGYAVLTMVLCLAGVGLPGLNSFVSEMLLLAGLFDPAHAPRWGFPLACAAVAGLFLGAWYTFTMLKRVFFGPSRTPPAGPPAPLTRAEGIALGLPAVLCLLLGLFPQPVLQTMTADAAVVVEQVRAARDRTAPPPARPAPPPR